MRLIHLLEPAILAAADRAAPQPVPEDEQATFGKGRHGQLLRQLCGFWSDDNAGTDTDAPAFTPDKILAALKLRNAVAHNAYPDIGYFPEVVVAVGADAVPENPDQHRRVAERLRQRLVELYRPWFGYLGIDLPAESAHG